MATPASIQTVETGEWTIPFEPKHWDALANQGAPAPYIPVLRGKTLQAYADALTSWGVDRNTGEYTQGNGYGEKLTTIIDPATGITGHVTQWEWNSRVEWEIWTEDGVERRGKSDVHAWAWDAVKTVRHVMAHAAFRRGGEAGELQGYWSEAPDFETARVANEDWLSKRLAALRR